MRPAAWPHRDAHAAAEPHLHLHHLVLALWAQRPLVGQVVVVVGALVPVQSDGVPWQLEDLEGAEGKRLLVRFWFLLGLILNKREAEGL